MHHLRPCLPGARRHPGAAAGRGAAPVGIDRALVTARVRRGGPRRPRAPACPRPAGAAARGRRRGGAGAGDRPADRRGRAGPGHRGRPAARAGHRRPPGGRGGRIRAARPARAVEPGDGRRRPRPDAAGLDRSQRHRGGRHPHRSRPLRRDPGLRGGPPRGVAARHRRGGRAAARGVLGGARAVRLAAAVAGAAHDAVVAADAAAAAGDRARAGARRAWPIPRRSPRPSTRWPGSADRRRSRS